MQREKDTENNGKKMVYYYAYRTISGIVKDILIRDSFKGRGKSFLVTIDSGGEEVGLSFGFVSNGRFSSAGEDFAKKFGNLYGLIAQGQKLTFSPYDIPPNESKDGKRAVGMSILFNGSKISHYYTKDNLPPEAQAFQEWDPVANKHSWNYKNQVAFIYTNVSSWIEQLRAQGILRPIQQAPAQAPAATSQPQYAAQPQHGAPQAQYPNHPPAGQPQYAPHQGQQQAPPAGAPGYTQAPPAQQGPPPVQHHQSPTAGAPGYTQAPPAQQGPPPVQHHQSPTAGAPGYTQAPPAAPLHQAPPAYNPASAPPPPPPPPQGQHHSVAAPIQNQPTVDQFAPLPESDLPF
ncbi:MAG: hypothetical protein E6Q68_05970 [Polynucleobacter sp.]|nr:MAG: hypothetical protein E6Q68_05970 [Polynucleobacter sp.]